MNTCVQLFGRLSPQENRGELNILVENRTADKTQVNNPTQKKKDAFERVALLLSNTHIVVGNPPGWEEALLRK